MMLGSEVASCWLWGASPMQDRFIGQLDMANALRFDRAVTRPPLAILAHDQVRRMRRGDSPRLAISSFADGIRELCRLRDCYQLKTFSWTLRGGAADRYIDQPEGACCF